MSTESDASRRVFLKSSAASAAGLGGLADPSAARGADKPHEATYDGKTIGHWVAQLKDRDSGARSAAAAALGRIGPAAKGAVPGLTAALKDRHAQVRYDAAAALGQIGPAAKGAVPALIDCLKEEDERSRRAAAWALGHIGPEARAAVPALIDLLKGGIL